MTAGREQDARETLRDAVQRLVALGELTPLGAETLLDVLALLPSPPATTGAVLRPPPPDLADVLGGIADRAEEGRALVHDPLAAASPPATGGDAP